MWRPDAVLVRSIGAALAAAAAGCFAGCTLTGTEAPAISGPSELALAITLQATPDVLTRDGTSQSIVTVVARDAHARPVAALALRADIAGDGAVHDFGRLSARSLTTGMDGRTAIAYTAPEPVDDVSMPATITIEVTPLTGDARSHVPRAIDIRLVPASTP